MEEENLKKKRKKKEVLFVRSKKRIVVEIVSFNFNKQTDKQTFRHTNTADDCLFVSQLEKDEEILKADKNMTKIKLRLHDERHYNEIKASR